MKKCLYVLSVLLIGVGLYGCGEKDDTVLAKTEEARIAMDNGDFKSAVNILKPLLDKDGDGDFTPADVPLLGPQDSELAVDLASAYFGRAGVNFLEILRAAAAVTSKTEINRGLQSVYVALQKGLRFLAPPVFAQSTTVDCLNDQNFNTVAKALPTLAQDNLDDVDLGIAILDKVKGFVTTNIDSLQKKVELMRAVGHFARVVMNIIEATDTNENNIPDTFTPTATTTGITDNIASRVDTSFGLSLQAITDSGILGTADGTNFNENDLSDRINKLKNTIDSNSDGSIIASELSSYLSGLIQQCSNP